MKLIGVDLLELEGGKKTEREREGGREEGKEGGRQEGMRKREKREKKLRVLVLDQATFSSTSPPQVKVWDTAGSEKYMSISAVYYRYR